MLSAEQIFSSCPHRRMVPGPMAHHPPDVRLIGQWRRLTLSFITKMVRHRAMLRPMTRIQTRNLATLFGRIDRLVKGVPSLHLPPLGLTSSVSPGCPGITRRPGRLKIEGLPTSKVGDRHKFSAVAKILLILKGRILESAHRGREWRTQLHSAKLLMSTAVVSGDFVSRVPVASSCDHGQAEY